MGIYSLTTFAAQVLGISAYTIVACSTVCKNAHVAVKRTVIDYFITISLTAYSESNYMNVLVICCKIRDIDDYWLNCIDRSNVNFLRTLIYFTVVDFIKDVSCYFYKSYEISQINEILCPDVISCTSMTNHQASNIYFTHDCVSTYITATGISDMDHHLDQAHNEIDYRASAIIMAII